MATGNWQLATGDGLKATSTARAGAVQFVVAVPFMSSPVASCQLPVAISQEALL